MDSYVSRHKILGYIGRLQNCGLGKHKSLEYLVKYVSSLPSAQLSEIEEMCDMDYGCTFEEYKEALNRELEELNAKT